MIKKLLLATTILGIGFAGQANAADVNTRIDQLEQEIKILKRQQEVAEEVAQADKQKQAKVELGSKGFVVSSADGRAQLGLRGYAQIDSRQFLDDQNSTGRDDILARRLRPIVTGKIDDFSFRLMPDFGGTATKLFDAHVDYKFSDPIQVRVGKFKPPIGLERLQSATDLEFAERGLPTNLAPNREFGAQFYGDIGSGTLEYQVGVFNGGPDLATTTNENDSDDKKDYVARIFTQPFKQTGPFVLKGLGLGVAGSVGDREGSTATTILDSYKSPGQQSVFSYRTGTYASGEQWRLYPQGYYYIGPFGVIGEYAVSNQTVKRTTTSEELQHKAWQIAASYVLTGEDASFKGVKPENNFKPSEGKWGAVEVAARVGQLDIDDKAFPLYATATSAITEETSGGVGINWYLNERVKLMLDYDQTKFEGGTTKGDRPDEKAIFTRVQYQF